MFTACASLICGDGTVEKDGICVPGGADTDADTDADAGADASPEATLFAPFVDATLYPVARIDDIAAETGVLTYNLGFVVSEWGTCEASWGGYYDVETGPESWGDGGQYFLCDEIMSLRARGET